MLLSTYHTNSSYKSQYIYFSTLIIYFIFFSAMFGSNEINADDPTHPHRTSELSKSEIVLTSTASPMASVISSPLVQPKSPLVPVEVTQDVTTALLPSLQVRSIPLGLVNTHNNNNNNNHSNSGSKKHNKKPTVLVVDDSTTNRKMLVMILTIPC